MKSASRWNLPARLPVALAAGVADWRRESDPETVSAYLATAAKLETALRSVSDAHLETDCFDLAEGLYAFATLYHGGQWCPLYSVSSMLQRRPISFRPGAMWRADRLESDGARRLYAYFVRAHGQSRLSAVAAAERAAVVLSVLCSACDPAGKGDA